MGDSGSPYSKAELRERSNFRLEDVFKVNNLGISLFFLTFWAQRDENAERRLFRGVVWRGDVMLWEIKGFIQWEIQGRHTQRLSYASYVMIIWIQKNMYVVEGRSNFRLEAVVKVNHLGISLFCLTFWAQRDENAERRLFRGVVWRGDVMLCEIKDGDDDISIPDGHVDDESRKYIRTEAYDRLWKWVQEMPDVCSEDESEDDSEDEKYDPGGRDGGVDVAGSAAGRIQNIPDVCSKDDSEDEKAVLQRGG